MRRSACFEGGKLCVYKKVKNVVVVHEEAGNFERAKTVCESEWLSSCSRTLARERHLQSRKMSLSPPPWSLSGGMGDQERGRRKRVLYRSPATLAPSPAVATGHWRKQVMIKVLIDLTRHVFHRFEGRRKEALASNQAAATALYGAWVCWREVVLEANASSHYTKVIVFHFYEAWRQRVALGKQARLRLSAASAHRHRALLRFTLNGWWWNVYRRQSKRRRYAEARRHRDTVLLAGCTAGWRHWTKSILSEEELERVAVRHRYRQRLLAGMSAFLLEHRQAHDALAMWDAAGQHSRWYMARKALRNWRAMAEVAERLRKLALEGACHRDAAVARFVLRHLRRAAADRILRDGKHKMARAHWARGLLSVVIGSWVEFQTSRKDEMRNELARSNISRVRLEILKLRRIFSSWVAQKVAGARKRRATLHAFLTLSRRAMLSWRAYVAALKSHRVALDSMGLYARKRAAVCVFFVLEQYTRANARSRRRNVRALHFWSLGMLRRALSAWMRQLAERMENKVLMQQALEAHRLFLVGRGLSRWTAFITSHHSAPPGILSSRRAADSSGSVLSAADTFARMEHLKRDGFRPSAAASVSIQGNLMRSPRPSISKGGRTLPGSMTWVESLVPHLRGASDFVQPREFFADRIGDRTGRHKGHHAVNPPLQEGPRGGDYSRGGADIVVGRGKEVGSPATTGFFGDAVLEGEKRLQKIISEESNARTGDRAGRHQAPSGENGRGPVQGECDVVETNVPSLTLAAVR